MPDIFDQLDQAQNINSVAQQFGVRPALVQALIRQESGGDPNTKPSAKGAVGLMQVMPTTAAQPGYGIPPFDPSDPVANLKGGMAILKAHLDNYQGDEAKALAAYNAGEGNVNSGKADTIPETQNYVAKISANAGTGPQPDIFSQLDAANVKTAAPAAAVQPPVVAAPQSSGTPQPNSLDSFRRGNEAPNTFLTGDALKRFAAGAWENLNPMGLVTAAMHPMDTATALVKAQTDQFAKAKQDYDAGHISEMLGHGAAGLLPLVGPAAARAGETISAGNNIAGGLGQAAGLIGSIVAPDAAGNVLHELVQPKLNAAAEHVANVNMQIPKALRRRELGSDFTPAQAVLSENRGTNPFGRLSQPGLDAARATGPVLTTQFDTLLAADAPKRYSLGPVDQTLADAQAALGHDINAQPKQAQVQTVRDNLRTNPLYSQGTTITNMVDQHVPASTILDETGQPMRPAQTIQVPVDSAGPRVLVPQTASELNTIKGNMDKGLPFGERGGTLDEVLKDARAHIDSIIDNNVPGADALNQRRAQNVVATKALDNAVLARQTKRHSGVAEALLFASPFAFGEGHPLMGAMAAAPWMYNTMVKHPSLASPVAAGAWAAGHYAMTPAGRLALGAGIPATNQIGAAPLAPPTDVPPVVLNRPVTKAELDAQYTSHLASTGQD